MRVAALIAPLLVLFAVGASAHPQAAPTTTAASVAGVGVPCCSRIVAAPVALSAPDVGGGPEQVVRASRWRVVERVVPHLLPVGLAPEAGLQVKTILVSRVISEVFPEIQQIGGVRADSLRWHPDGLALDVMIPNPGSAEGIALGDQIVAFALENAERFGLQDAIWRGTYYTPGGGAQAGGYGHYDHVHLTTTGGGYPTGGEAYLR